MTLDEIKKCAEEAVSRLAHLKKYLKVDFQYDVRATNRERNASC